GKIHENVFVLAMKDRVRLNLHLYIEISRPSAGLGAFTFTPKPHSLVIINSGRNLYRYGVRLFLATLTAAVLTFFLNDGSTTHALCAGPAQRKKSLVEANLSVAMARAAGLGLRPLFCSRTVARGTGNVFVEGDLFFRT